MHVCGEREGWTEDIRVCMSVEYIGVCMTVEKGRDGEDEDGRDKGREIEHLT